MFTGIIESSGKIESLTLNGSGKTFHISSPIGAELQPDQSVAHDGVCLTVENVVGETYQVTAVQETLQKTNLGQWQPGR